MHTSLQLSLAALGTAALSIASLPSAYADQAEVARSKEITPDQAERLTLIGATLKDIVKPKVGIQGQTRAAGTPHEDGLGGFRSLVLGSTSTYFANASIKDQALPADQKNLLEDSHTGLGQASLTRINGEVPPNRPTRATKSTTLIDVILDGRRRLVFRDERQKGTRSPIHEHPYGGLTCMIQGEMTLYLEGSKPQTAVPGGCYWMPPGKPMSGVNSGDETAVLLDIFDVPVGKAVWRVVEDGQRDLEQNFDKANSSTN